MSRSSLLLRALAPAVALALTATGALLTPGTAGAAGAVPTGAAGAVTAAVDTDGDGLDDALDGCSSVAAATSTGCPTAWRKVSLKRLAGKRRLEARVSSPVTACASRARIKLFLDRRGGTDKLLASDASYQGRRRFAVPAGGRYYALVTPTYASGVAECGKAVSRTVRVPR